MIKARIKATPNSYGFGHDWRLELHDKKNGRLRSFFLGQDVKVAQRIIGLEQRELISRAHNLYGTKNFDNKNVQGFLVRYLLAGLTHRPPEEFKNPKPRQAILKNILENAKDWSLACE